MKRYLKIYLFALLKFIIGLVIVYIINYYTNGGDQEKFFQIIICFTLFELCIMDTRKDIDDGAL